MTDEEAEQILAQALHAYYPVADISDWELPDLDELGLWAAAVDGCEISDTQQISVDAEHGQNSDLEMDE